MVAMGNLQVRGPSAPKTCAHLAPLERELEAAAVEVGPGRPCPHDADWGTWFAVDALFDVSRLERRLSLAPCVGYEEYEGLLCASDATFYCDECMVAIVGLHPRAAPPGTPRIA